MADRIELEIKRLKRLKKGDIIHIKRPQNAHITKAKVLRNFKNAQWIDLVDKRGLLNLFREPYSREYSWDGFDITLKEDLV